VTIPPRLEQDVDDVAVLVQGSPQVMTPPVNGDEQLLEMPRVAGGPTPTPEAPRVGGAECLTPVPDGFVPDVMPRCARRSSSSLKLSVKR
jgi:hypothetical protein